METVKEPEVIESGAPDKALMRRPNAPVSLTELAALRGEALEIIDTRVQILATIRKAALKATNPEDWILHKAPDDAGGQVIGYLQDAGCERVRDLFGINIFDVSKPEKIAGTDREVFHYIISGSGRCNLTLQVIENVEGGRSSTDDICKGKTGAELELLVRKSARANLDGRIVRDLAGLSSVPIAELEEAWQGTNKKSDRCRRGRGFGSRSERLGGTSTRQGAPDVEPPVCPHCKSKGVYRQAKGEPGTPGYRGPFYGCPKYETHSDKRWTVDVEKWVKEQQSKTPAQAAAPAGDPASPAASQAPSSEPQQPSLTGDDIPFGGSNRSRK